jgi:lysozyme family protein
MADFDIALPITLKFEGGWCDNPADPGGATNLGITMATFAHCAHPLLGIDPTVDNLRALTPAQAGIIYKANYWAPIKADSYPLQELSNIVFDFYVNAGTHASSLLQRVLNSMGVDPPLVVDGSIGAGTLAALAKFPATEVYSAYKQGRIDYYTALGRNYPAFLDGWLNRVHAFPDLPGAIEATAPVPQVVNGAAAAPPAP